MSNVVSQSFLEKIIEVWQEEVLAIILFGSAARGELQSHSDIDLLLVLAPQIEISREYYRRWEMFYDNNRVLISHEKEISPHFVNLASDPLQVGGLWYEVALEGMVLWQKDPSSVGVFLMDIPIGSN